MPGDGNFCLSEFRVFGNAPGNAPQAVKGFKVARDKADPRNAMITWTPVDGAYGYNIYFGTRADKLYHCITVNGDNHYDLRGLDLGTSYCFAIETGRSPRSKIIQVK